MTGTWFAVTRTRTGGLRCVAVLSPGGVLWILDAAGRLRPDASLLFEYQIMRDVFSTFTEITEAEAHRLAARPAIAES